MAQSLLISIGAVLSGNFTSTFSKADTSVKGLAKTVGVLDKALGAVNLKARSITTSFNAATRALTNFHRASERSLGVNKAVDNNARIIKSNLALSRSYQRLQRQREKLSLASMAPMGPPVSSRLPIVVPSRRGGGVSGTGSGVGRGMAVGTAAGRVGMTSMVAGAVGFWGVKGMVKPAMEYQHQLVMMNAAGMTHKEIMASIAKSYQTLGQVPTSSLSENLLAIRELRMVFGDTRHAIEHMATVQKTQGILESLIGHGAGDQAYTIAKALELKGAVKTPQQFEGAAKWMTAAIVAGGGKIQAVDFLSAFKFGRNATAGWNDEFAYKILPTLIQEMKSGGGGGVGGPGNALMSAFSAVVGGVLPAKAIVMWDKLGLVEKGSMVKGKKGGVKGLKPGGLKGAETFYENPFEWSQKYLIPAMEKHGYRTEKQQRMLLQYLFPNRTAGFVMSQMATQPWKFQRDVPLIEKAFRKTDYDQLVKSDPRMAQVMLKKQWESLMATIGFEIMPDLVAGAIKLTKGFVELSGWFKENPNISRMLGKGAIIMSSVLVIAGALGLLVKAVTSTAKALAVISGYKWLWGIPKPPVAPAGAGGIPGVVGAPVAGGLSAGALLGSAVMAAAMGYVAYRHMNTKESKKTMDMVMGGMKSKSFTPTGPENPELVKARSELQTLATIVARSRAEALLPSYDKPGGGSRAMLPHYEKLLREKQDEVERLSGYPRNKWWDSQKRLKATGVIDDSGNVDQALAQMRASLGILQPSDLRNIIASNPLIDQTNRLKDESVSSLQSILSVLERGTQAAKTAAANQIFNIVVNASGIAGTVDALTGSVSAAVRAAAGAATSNVQIPYRPSDEAETFTDH